MGANEVQNWIAYCALEDSKYRERIEKEITLRKQQQEDYKSRATSMRNFLNKLGN